jgi:uncharacterized membrane protein
MTMLVRPASVLLLTAVLAGCGSTTDSSANSTSCPTEHPTTCPSPEPSYSAEVGPILKNHCVVCHAPGGVEASKPLTTQAEVASRKGEVFNQVYACNMPPAGQPPLSTEERNVLFEWLNCGAPNN